MILLPGLPRRAGTAVVAALALAAAAGCSDSGSGSDPDTLTFWSPLFTPAGVAAMEEAMAGFTEQTQIEVSVVGMQETQMAETITSAAASGQLPDVIMHALDYTIGWADQGLLDAEAATDVIGSLGQETFNPGALAYVETEGGFGAVPTDGWGQMLYYRTDLFEQAGLPAPDTYQAIAQRHSSSTATACKASCSGPPRVSGSPCRASSTSRWPTTASWSMRRARSRWTVHSAWKRWSGTRSC